MSTGMKCDICGTDCSFLTLKDVEYIEGQPVLLCPECKVEADDLGLFDEEGD